MISEISDTPNIVYENSLLHMISFNLKFQTCLKFITAMCNSESFPLSFPLYHSTDLLKAVQHSKTNAIVASKDANKLMQKLMSCSESPPAIVNTPAIVNSPEYS